MTDARKEAIEKVGRGWEAAPEAVTEWITIKDVDPTIALIVKVAVDEAERAIVRGRLLERKLELQRREEEVGVTSEESDELDDEIRAELRGESCGRREDVGMSDKP